MADWISSNTSYFLLYNAGESIPYEIVHGRIARGIRGLDLPGSWESKTLFSIENFENAFGFEANRFQRDVLEFSLVNLRTFIGDLTIAGHNIEFDKAFLKAAWNKFLFSKWDMKSLDTLQLAYKYLHGVSNYKFHTLTKELQPDSNPVNTHRAIPDCRLTYQLLMKLREKAERNKNPPFK